MEQQYQKYKICLVGECLSTGGAERAMALLSDFFVSKGIEVHLVVVLDSVTYPYSGELLNLGKLKNKSNGPLNKLKRFRTLKKFLSVHRFDAVIDFRVRTSFLQEYLISRLLYDASAVYTVHSSILPLYFPSSGWQARLIYGKKRLVAVAQEIEERIRYEFGLNEITTLYNPVAIPETETVIDINYPFIVAAGRMKDNIKQFDGMIAAYAKSSLPQKGIRLVILGDGKKRPELEQVALKSGVAEQVVFTGFVENPQAYFSKALFFVLSSQREGLPTVILESLASGTPVVAFDCATGPKEMISDRENGLLVLNQHWGGLTDAMDLFTEDKALYDFCKSNAKRSVEKFSLDRIGRQWLEYLKIDVS